MTLGVPLFLLAALAGIIPVLMHMINRQNAPALPFSTLRFLHLSVQRTRRRRYIHDALLLALRVAALLLIALALARPAVHRLYGWLGGRTATAVALILDNSASMSTVDQTGPRWERATLAAEQVLDTLQEGDQTALLLTNGPAVLPSRGLYQNHEVVRQALTTCRPSYERADLAAALHEARRLLDKTTAANKEIYVVTDLQATSWRDAKPPKNDKNQEPDPPPLIVINVRGPRQSNSALSKLKVEATAPVAGAPLRVTVEVLGDADVEQERHVALYVDDQKLNTSPTLRIPPGQSANHTFQFSLRDQGLHRGEVRLDGKDACPADDRLFFAANINPAIPVAVVKPAEHEISYLDQAYYLQRALDSEPGRQGAIQVRALTPTALARESLAQFVVVFCVDLPAPSREIAQQLVAYVQGGGHLVWVCGENVDPVAYSTLNDQVDGKLLPIRLTGIGQASDERPDGWRIGWLDPENPIVGPFAEPASLHQSVFVYRYVQMPPIQGSGAQVLARLDDGEPLLVQKSIGFGSVYLLATSMHVQWTNFPLRPLFLPLVARMTFELAGANANQPLLTAGTPWTLPLAGGEDVRVEIVQPGGDVVRFNRADPESGPLRFTDTHQVGIYDARIQRGPRTHHAAFAVNPDPEESAPALLRQEDLQSRLGLEKIVFCNDPTTVAETIENLRHGKSLWEVFLIIVLFTLVAEAFVSNRRSLNANRIEQGPRVPGAQPRPRSRV